MPSRFIIVLTTLALLLIGAYAASQMLMPKLLPLTGPIAEDSELWRLMKAARAAEREKDYKLAIEHYTAALKIEPGPNWIARDLHASRGSIYNYADMPNEAYADYDAALRDGYILPLTRTTARWYMGRGYASLQLRHYRRAKEDFDIVLKEVPNASNALAWRGASHQGLGDRDKAIADYKAALSIDPGNRRALDYLKDIESQ